MPEAEPVPEKKQSGGMSKTTISLIVSGVASGLLMAMQGLTLHEAGNVQQTTERVGNKASVELQALQELQKSSNQELQAWAEIRAGLQKGIDRQGQRQIELLNTAAANQKELLDALDKLPKVSASSEELRAWGDLRQTIKESMERQMMLLQNAAENQKQILAVLGIPKNGEKPTPTPTPNPQQ